MLQFIQVSFYSKLLSVVTLCFSVLAGEDSERKCSPSGTGRPRTGSLNLHGNPVWRQHRVHEKYSLY